MRWVTSLDDFFVSVLCDCCLARQSWSFGDQLGRIWAYTVGRERPTFIEVLAIFCAICRIFQN